MTDPHPQHRAKGGPAPPVASVDIADPVPAHPPTAEEVAGLDRRIGRLERRLATLEASDPADPRARPSSSVVDRSADAGVPTLAMATMADDAPGLRRAARPAPDRGLRRRR